ncbi:glycosyl hydrolase family 3 [Bowmanella sp. Y57]|uniref:beta-N-acetylhexosaminidase n=2 Tax=Bowmanella yangjiangensis TaxID=2811230 RepID=A0ABS3CSW7_9ALTE|nr:glycosyl hydrolase family 3 [Bowmanella yangjiangensis]
MTSCSPVSQPAAKLSDAQLRDDLAQKIMIDLRYYCEQAPEKGLCRTPMTELPDDLAGLIRDTGVGGVILFAENLTDVPQMVRLNRAMQLAASQSKSQQPLFISLDQEGGRVARVPRHLGTAFAGNMAIGATYQKHGLEYAKATGTVLGKELKSLGFNVNHAPTVDVNVNPDNPVINVRSFGEDASLVAKLGIAQMQAMQEQGVIGTLKHFPGHGDTAVDSHTGLPLVEHDRATIDKVDLLPFRRAIEQGLVETIMTAHIQYPALDDSKLVSKTGELILRPATLSRAILTDLLRGELGFKGLIVTDAMDMAGISHFFEPTQAVIETFKAGTDMVLMPVRLHSKEELKQLPELIEALMAAIKSGELSAEEVHASAERIRASKARYVKLDQASEADAIAKAEAVVGADEHKALEQALSDDALTLIRGTQDSVVNKIQSLHLVMPDRSKCLAMQQALRRNLPSLSSSCASLQGFDAELNQSQMADADLLLIASITPAQSAVERGGMEDMSLVKADALDHQAQQALIPALIKQAKSQNKAVAFVSLRTPYETARLAKDADLVLATYAYNSYVIPGTEAEPQIYGPAFETLARFLSGKITATGHLPVSVKQD